VIAAEKAPRARLSSLLREYGGVRFIGAFADPEDAEGALSRLAANVALVSGDGYA
jgi:hypothetical protein